MQFIYKICRSIYIAYFAFKCTPHFADGVASLPMDGPDGERPEVRVERAPVSWWDGVTSRHRVVVRVGRRHGDPVKVVCVHLHGRWPHRHTRFARAAGPGGPPSGGEAAGEG